MARIGSALLIIAMFLSCAPVAAAAETGVATPALSYCAHWFARDGNACVTSAGAGQLVVPDANNRQQVEAAMNHCKRTGCKVALYCECGYRGVNVTQVARLFGDVVQRFGTGTIVNQVEVDHIRDISPQARATVARELAQHGFGLILKNSPDVSGLSGTVPIVRVVYEDIVNDSSYRAEMRQLAQQLPSLLITGIVHQGAYGGDGGATPQQADAVFAQFKDFKNVELFYGMPTSFKRAKSFDGQMDSLAREIGHGTLTPGGPGAVPLGGPGTTPFSQTDNRLLGDVRKMLQPSSPYSQISPASSGPLPGYLNPLKSMPSALQPIAPSALTSPTSSASSLLDLLTNPAPANREQTSITLIPRDVRAIPSTRPRDAAADGAAPGLTSVTTFPVLRATTEYRDEEGVLLRSIRLAIDGIARIVSSLFSR